MSHTLWTTLSHRADRMAEQANRDIRTLDAWQAIRPQRHREFMRCLGLDPLPPRCDLKLTEHGTFCGEGYTACNLSFQLLPDCWGSGALYYPHPLPPEKLPAVLYVCGHGSIGTYHYQVHPMMWARRGYACLIVDTIEQNDNPGEHHGTGMHRQDAWLALGYTPAGAEVWNAMRGADILQADPHVDRDRLAITGVSGGGACSFHAAVADERFKAVSTLCGVSSPRDAITNRHLLGHCDCIYPINVYGRDISEYAALLAPRAARFCFAENDPLFHAAETRDLVERTRRVYSLYGEDDRCRLVPCPGPHGDHPEFDEATAACFDDAVGGSAHPAVPRGEREQPEHVTSIFHGTPPTPDRLDLFPRLIVPRGTVPLPRTPDEWPVIRDEARDRLNNETLLLLDQHRTSAGATFTHRATWCWGAGTEMQAHSGSIDGQDVYLQYVRKGSEKQPLVLGIANEGETSMHALDFTACAVDPARMAYGGFEGRMAGFNAMAPGIAHQPPGSRIAPVRTMLRMAMGLVGTTPVMETCLDLSAAVDYLCSLDDMAGRTLFLHGRGDGAVAALYCALRDERITGLILEQLPSSHLDGSPILGILRVMDIPHAVGLMAPRPVALVQQGHSFWTWPSRVYERLGHPDRLIMAADARQAMEKVVTP